MKVSAPCSVRKHPLTFCFTFIFRIPLSIPLSQLLDKSVENAARPVAVGRKNYLFCQNDDTAESTAIIYSFMGCCKAAGVDFRTWMIYFLDHVHDYDQDYTKDIADLLPDNLNAARAL